LWACDSNARSGETALVLFTPIAKQGHWRDVRPLQTAVRKRFGGRVPPFAIAWHGWGRLQATRRSGEWWVAEPPYRDPPVEFKRQRKGGAVPLHLAPPARLNPGAPIRRRPRLRGHVGSKQALCGMGAGEAP
jgi:hypothetical protein